LLNPEFSPSFLADGVRLPIGLLIQELFTPPHLISSGSPIVNLITQIWRFTANSAGLQVLLLIDSPFSRFRFFYF